MQWLVGLGAKGSEGVAGVVKQTPGAICYVESAYAKQNNLSTALLQNKAGHFVGPTVDAITAAAAGGMPSMPADFRVSITNADGDATYPIVTMTYLLINQNQPDQNKGKALVDFVNWALGDGQKLASGLDYAPLPRELIQMVLAEVRTIKYGGKPLST